MSTAIVTYSGTPEETETFYELSSFNSQSPACLEMTVKMNSYGLRHLILIPWSQIKRVVIE